MRTLSQLKEKAEELCPYPIGAWREAKFDRRAQSADSAWARCKGEKAVLSVIVRPPEGVSHIALVHEDGPTIPLTDNGKEPGDVDDDQVEQLPLL